MTQMSKDLEASRQRLREMLSCAEDLSNVAREIFTYSGSFLTVVNISLSDLYIGAQQHIVPHRLSSR